MTGLAIQSPADAILERLGPPLLQTWDRDDVRIGGGTALAARWHHRRSTDIDLWVAPDLFRRAGEDFKNLAIEAGAANVRSGRGWLNGLFPEGEFSISTTEPVLEPGTGEERESRFGLPLESVPEILARKLALRMYGNGEFVSRDFYDICTASERDGAALERALTALSSDERSEVAREISGYGPSANSRGRPLTEVHRPEWLPDLAGRTARIVEYGPERTRAASPSEVASRRSADVPNDPASPEDTRQRLDRQLQLTCAITERIAPCPEDGDFHRRLPKPIQDALAAAGKAGGVSQEAVDELAAKIARARAETDLRVELTREFSDSTLHEFKARFEGHPRFSRGDMLNPYDAAIKERIATLDRTPPVPDELEQTVARAAVASDGTSNEDTARKMVQALKCGTVPDAEEIRTRQKALLADLAQPGEIETDADKDRLAQEVYRCFTLEETQQICDGRGPFLETLPSDADRSRVAARFKALHDVEIVGPAPWAILHRRMQSTLAERNAPGERIAGRSDPAEASRFPRHET